MSSDVQLHVPPELKSTLFFPEESISIAHYKMKEWNKPSSFAIFPYDLAFYQEIEGYHPWEHGEKHVSFLFTEWRKIEVECQQLFLERKTKLALEPMKEGIALFFSIIFWIHKLPVQLKEWESEVKKFPIKPVNLVERLSFVVQRPALYHSFIQLSELFRELEKHYVSSLIKKSP